MQEPCSGSTSADEGDCTNAVAGSSPASLLKLKVNLDPNAPITGFHIAEGENDRLRFVVGYPSSVHRSVIAEIPPGTYTGGGLAAALENALELAAAGAALVQNYSVGFDEQFGEFEVRLVSTDARQFRFKVTSGMNDEILFRKGQTYGKIELNPGNSTKEFTPSSLAAHLENRLETGVGGLWEVQFIPESGLYRIMRMDENWYQDVKPVELLWAASETTAEALFGFSRNTSLGGGTWSVVSQIAPYQSVDFQTYETTIEPGTNSGLVATSGTTSTRIELEEGGATPSQLAGRLQAAIRASGLPGADLIAVMYDEGSGNFFFRNPKSNSHTLSLMWGANDASLRTDESIPDLFGFTRESADLILSPGSTERSTTAPGRFFRFARLVRFMSDPNGGPWFQFNADGSTDPQWGDDVDPGQSILSSGVAGQFDPRNATGTSNFSAPVVYMDPDRNLRAVKLHFRRIGRESAQDVQTGRTLMVGVWEWFAGEDLVGKPHFEVTLENNALLFSIGRPGSEFSPTPLLLRGSKLPEGSYDFEAFSELLENAFLAADPAARVGISFQPAIGRFALTNQSTRSIALVVNTPLRGNPGASAGLGETLGFESKSIELWPGSRDVALTGTPPSRTSEIPVGRGFKILSTGILKFSDTGSLFESAVNRPGRLRFDFGLPTQEWGTGMDSSTQMSGPSSIISATAGAQDAADAKDGGAGVGQPESCVLNWFPKATTQAEIGVNLDSTSEIKGFNVVAGENDRFQLNVGYPSSVYKTVTATIDPGVYTGSSLASKIEAALEAAVQSAGLVHDYSVTYHKEFGRFNITLNSTNASGYQFTLTEGVNNQLSLGVGTTTQAMGVGGRVLTLSAGTYTAGTLATAMETKLESIFTGSNWTVTFDSSAGKFTIKADTLGSGATGMTGVPTGVLMGWAAPRTNLEGIMGFTVNSTFNTGSTDTSDVAPFSSVDFQTYRTTIEPTLNSGLVIRSWGKSTRVDLAPGTYTPNELARALQTAIRGSGLTGTDQFQVIYDEGARDFVFRNPPGSDRTLTLDWNFNGPTSEGTVLKTDESLPALFGFTRTNADLEMAPGSAARSSTNGALAPGRFYEFARMIGFVTDAAGGPRPTQLVFGSTLNQITDDVDPGETRVSDEVAGRFDSRDAANTANFSTSLVAYDRLGNSRVVELHFRKDAKESVTDSFTGRTLEVRRWEWFAGISQSDSAHFTVTDSNNTLLVTLEGPDPDERFGDGDVLTPLDLTEGIYTGAALASHLEFKLRGLVPSAEVTVSYNSYLGKFVITNNSTSRHVAIHFSPRIEDGHGDKTDAGFADLFGFDTSDSNDCDGLNSGTLLMAAPTSGVVPNASNSITSRFAVGTGLEIEAAGILKFSDEGKLFDTAVPENPESTSIGESKYGFLDGLAPDFSDFDFDSGAMPDQNIKFIFGTTTQSGGSGVNRSTQYNAEAIVNSMSQDGFDSGTVDYRQDPLSALYCTLTTGEPLPPGNSSSPK